MGPPVDPALALKAVLQLDPDTTRLVPAHVHAHALKQRGQSVPEAVVHAVAAWLRGGELLRPRFAPASGCSALSLSRALSAVPVACLTAEEGDLIEDMVIVEPPLEEEEAEQADLREHDHLREVTAEVEVDLKAGVARMLKKGNASALCALSLRVARLLAREEPCTSPVAHAWRVRARGTLLNDFTRSPSLRVTASVFVAPSNEDGETANPAALPGSHVDPALFKVALAWAVERTMPDLVLVRVPIHPENVLRFIGYGSDMHGLNMLTDSCRAACRDATANDHCEPEMVLRVMQPHPRGVTTKPTTGGSSAPRCEVHVCVWIPPRFGDNDTPRSFHFHDGNQAASSIGWAKLSAAGDKELAATWQAVRTPQRHAKFHAQALQRRLRALVDAAVNCTPRLNQWLYDQEYEHDKTVARSSRKRALKAEVTTVDSVRWAWN